MARTRSQTAHSDAVTGEDEDPSEDASKFSTHDLEGYSDGDYGSYYTPVSALQAPSGNYDGFSSNPWMDNMESGPGASAEALQPMNEWDAGSGMDFKEFVGHHADEGISGDDHTSVIDLSSDPGEHVGDAEPESDDSDEGVLPRKPENIIKSLGSMPLKIKIPAVASSRQKKTASPRKVKTRTPAKSKASTLKQRHLAAKISEKAALSKKAGEKGKGKKKRAVSQPEGIKGEPSVSRKSTPASEKKQRAALRSISPTKPRAKQEPVYPNPEVQMDFLFCDDAAPVPISPAADELRRGRVGRPPRMQTSPEPLQEFSVHAFVAIPQAPRLVQKTPRAAPRLEAGESAYLGPLTITHETTWPILLEDIAECTSIAKENLDLRSLRWRPFVNPGTKAKLAGWLPLCSEAGLQAFVDKGVNGPDGADSFIFTVAPLTQRPPPPELPQLPYNNPSASSAMSTSFYPTPDGAVYPQSHAYEGAANRPQHAGVGMFQPPFPQAPGSFPMHAPPAYVPAASPWVGPGMQSLGANQSDHGSAGQYAWNPEPDLVHQEESVPAKKSGKKNAASMDKLTATIEKLEDMHKENTCLTHRGIRCVIDSERGLHFHLVGPRLRAWASEIVKGRANLWKVPSWISPFNAAEALAPVRHPAPENAESAHGLPSGSHAGYGTAGQPHGVPMGPPGNMAYAQYGYAGYHAGPPHMSHPGQRAMSMQGPGHPMLPNHSMHTAPGPYTHGYSAPGVDHPHAPYRATSAHPYAAHAPPHNPYNYHMQPQAGPSSGPHY